MFLLRLGSLDLALWHFVAAIGALFVVGWWIRGVLLRVSGTWERVDEGVPPERTERISFVQFGPFVRGRRLMKGGFQEFTGYMRGRTMFLTRRDHGAELLITQGFPKELVTEIDGTVTAKLRLTLSVDGQAIFGTFIPQKIEFTHRPPAVTRRAYLEPTYRRYRLVTRALTEDESIDVKPASEGARRSS